MKKFLVNFSISAVIFLLNLALIWPLFLGGYTQQMGSIESVFIAEARFISQNFPHLSWNPYWYTGFPFHLFYTPLLQSLMVLSNTLYSAISLASWYRIFIGLFYALTPVSFYFLVSFLTRRKIVGLMSALAFSFLPSLGYLLPPGGLASIHGWAPWRLLTLILFGEGGHIVGLFFLPLALLFFIKGIRGASWKNVFLASFLTALLALTNLIALISFAVMLIIVLMVEFLEGEWVKKLGRAVVISFFSYGLVAFWFNLSFVKTSLSIGTGGAEGSVGEAYLRLIPLLFLVAPVFFILAILGKRKVLKPIFMALGWILIFFVAAYFWFRNETMLLPQPNRYFPEMDMGTALLVSWGVVLLIERVFSRKWNWIGKVFYILISLLILCLPLRYIKHVWDLASPHPDITQTSEHRVATWLEENTQSERVYASGSTAFWLNTFTNVPQVRGGNDGVANSWILHAVYQINTSENAPQGKEEEVAGWWLRALNVSYLVVNFPSSKEIFHDFRNPEKFAQIKGVEEEVNLNGDVIYKTPLRQPSLAQVVSKTDFSALVEPKNAVDVNNLEKYVDYVDGATYAEASAAKAEFSWLGIGRAMIKANLKEDEGIGVQVAYDPGWRAYLDQKRIPVKEDVIGFLFLDPPKGGEVEINLVYGRTWDVWLGYFLTLLTIGCWIIYPQLSLKVTKLLKKAEKEWEKEE